MSQPPSYPGSGDNPESPGGDQPSYGGDQPTSGSDYPPPPTHQPYGSPSPAPYEQQGFGQPGYGQQPGGQFGQPYGAWQGGNDASRSTDGVSIAGFVLSLTCCLSLVGLILGLVGLSRTKNDQRKGRWAAIAAIPIGVIGTLILAGTIIGVVWFAGQVVTPENAKVGQCVNVEEFDDDDESIGMTKSDCDDSPDAQIVAVQKVTTETEGLAVLAFCEQAIAPERLSAIQEHGGLTIQGVTDDPPADAGDKVVCYVENTDGSSLDGKVVD